MSALLLSMTLLGCGQSSAPVSEANTDANESVASGKVMLYSSMKESQLNAIKNIIKYAMKKIL